MPQPDAETTHKVGRWLVQRLRFAERPVTRDVLAADLQQHAAATWGVHWSRTTAARRLREGIKAARREGFPVVSLGEGFQLARSRAERHQAAERLREMARDLLAEAAVLESVPVPGDARQGELFAAVNL